MRLGIVTYLIGAEMTLPELLDLCRQTGIEGVELRTTHKHGVEVELDEAGRQAVRRAFEESGVELWGLGTACEFHSADPAEVQRNIDLTRDFVLLAKDVGARGVKVRPNGLVEGVPPEKTLAQVGMAYRECARFGAEHGIELWMEVHGRQTCDPRHMHTIMQTADHPNARLCWNSNAGEPDADGSVKWAFDLLHPWLASCHINELADPAYPWEELFRLLKQGGYGDRFTLAEIQSNPDPVRFLKFYRALWEHMTR
jgi:hypothetical protein